MAEDLRVEGTELISQLEALAKQYQLVAIYTFGSRAKEIAARLAGEAIEAEYTISDVDIGVLPTDRIHLTAKDKVRLMASFEDLFTVPRVDLIVLPEAPTFLALDIVRGELLFTSDSDAEADYQLYILRCAGDLASWELERRRMVLDGEAY
jgi:predicted nucleotidyltransferase